MIDLNLEHSKDKWCISSVFPNGYNYCLDNYDYKAHRRIWSQLFSEGFFGREDRILLINDGDQILYNTITEPAIVTIVDKYSYMFCEPPYKKYISTREFVNIRDSLGYCRKLTLLDFDIHEAISDECFKNKFEVIFVNVRDNSEITPLMIEQYFSQLSEFGILLLQVKDGYLNYKNKTYLEHYFTNLFEKVRSTHTSQESFNYLAYRKISALV